MTEVKTISLGTLAAVVGSNVRMFRDGKGYSQSRLGELIGDYLGREALPKQWVSKAERGKQSLSAEEAVATALALGVPVTKLLTAHTEVTEDHEVTLTDSGETWTATVAELREAVMGDAEAAAQMEVRAALIARFVGIVGETAMPITPVKSTRTKPRRKR